MAIMERDIVIPHYPTTIPLVIWPSFTISNLTIMNYSTITTITSNTWTIRSKNTWTTWRNTGESINKFARLQIYVHTYVMRTKCPVIKLSEILIMHFTLKKIVHNRKLYECLLDVFAEKVFQTFSFLILNYCENSAVITKSINIIVKWKQHLWFFFMGNMKYSKNVYLICNL